MWRQVGRGSRGHVIASRTAHHACTPQARTKTGVYVHGTARRCTHALPADATPCAAARAAQAHGTRDAHAVGAGCAHSADCAGKALGPPPAMRQPQSSELRHAVQHLMRPGAAALLTWPRACSWTWQTAGTWPNSHPRANTYTHLNGGVVIDEVPVLLLDIQQAALQREVLGGVALPQLHLQALQQAAAHSATSGNLADPEPPLNTTPHSPAAWRPLPQWQPVQPYPCCLAAWRPYPQGHPVQPCPSPTSRLALASKLHQLGAGQGHIPHRALAATG